MKKDLFKTPEEKHAVAQIIKARMARHKRETAIELAAIRAVGQHFLAQMDGKSVEQLKELRSQMRAELEQVQRSKTVRDRWYGTTPEAKERKHAATEDSTDAELDDETLAARREWGYSHLYNEHFDLNK